MTAERARQTAISSSSTADDDVFAGATILVADDHQPNLDLLEQILLRAGASDIHLTTDAGSVVARYLELRPDIVLLDLHMPGMDGVAVIEAMQRVTAENDFVPVIVLTADATPAARDRVLTAGANDFLTKPVDRTEVVLRTRNLLQSRRLHRNVQDHNAALQLEIEERTAAERHAAVELERERREIDEVLATDGMRMVFQPITALESGRTVGYEALARFDRTPIRPPNEWFAQAERVGRGIELELAAVDAALRQLEGIPGDTFLSVNLSPTTATSPHLARLLRAHPGERLVVEITEHAAVADYDTIVETLDRLGGGALRVAVDDAGAGYASLQHILRLHPHIIKLDITLVRDIDADPVKRALASSLVSFAREIESTIIAEGVETAAELDTLVRLGVAWGQGFHLGRPGQLLPVDAHASA